MRFGRAFVFSRDALKNWLERIAYENSQGIGRVWNNNIPYTG